MAGAFYAEEDEVWRCTLHPTKRRRSTGVCHLCLKDRLSALCPDCATVRPCACSPPSSSCSPSTSSSTSSSFSLHLSDTGAVIPSSSSARISTLIDSEPPFHRSRSSAFPFFRSARFSSSSSAAAPPLPDKKTTSSIWGVFWGKSKREKPMNDGEMKRSKSLAASVTAERMAAPVKGKGWYFPSPMKVFRHSKASKVAHQRSPLHRG